VQVLTDQAQGLVTTLRVLLSSVFGNQRCAPVKLLNQVEGKAAFGYVAVVFGGVIGETRGIIVPT